jgi:hypothetical protein
VAAYGIMLHSMALYGALWRSLASYGSLWHLMALYGIVKWAWLYALEIAFDTFIGIC